MVTQRESWREVEWRVESGEERREGGKKSKREVNDCV